jgi:integrase
MAERIKFTETTVKALPAPASGRIEYLDTRVAGLYLRVTSKGVKTFSYFGRPKGSSKMERVTIGKWPAVKVEEAQTRALTLAGELASGSSVAAASRAKRNEMTVAELFDLYLDRSRAKRKDVLKGIFDNYIAPQFGTRKLSEVSHTMVSRWHNGIPAAIVRQRQQEGRAHSIKPNLGHRTANVAADHLRALFNFAKVQRLYADENPTSSVKRFAEVERDRFIKRGELRPFFEALAAYPNPTMRSFFFVALLTGARRTNVAAMRWVDVDLDDATWRLEETKNGTPQTVTLAPAVVDLLKQIKPEDTKAKPWVFPSARAKSKTGHMVEPKGAWKKILQTAGLSDLRLHDLRRTLGSWQAASGSSLQVIGKSLNHKSVSATAIYARLDLDPVRESVERAAGAILTHAGAIETAKILPLKKSG